VISSAEEERQRNRSERQIKPTTGRVVVKN